MKNKTFFGLLLFLIIFSLSILNCSSGPTSNVTIHINLGLHNENALNTHESSIFDRFLRLFTKDAKAQSVPIGITSFGLAVTGEGMDAINKTYAMDTTTITLEVPAGPARMFQLTAYRPTGDYAGSAAQDLIEGTSVDIPITMAAQYASVTINPSFPNGTPASAALTYTLNVTTSSQTVLSSSFTSGTPIQVPAGDAKDFEVLISTPSATFRAASTQNLTANSSITLAANMTLYETKLVIPDWNNSRIVQIDDMTGANWAQRIRTDIGYPLSIFRPQDVGFDAKGSMYIANDTPDSAGGVIILRINDITATNFTQIIPGNATGIDAMAIDTKNNFIYYSVKLFSTIYKVNIDGTPVSTIALPAGPTTFNTIDGLAIDPDSGKLYVSGQGYNVAYFSLVWIYDTSTGTWGQSYTWGNSGETAMDVIIKSPYLYVANLGGSGADSQILQLDMSTMTLVKGYGASYSVTDTAPGHFYGPSHFVAILNRKIYIIDEAPSAFTLSKLISMDDIDGTNWETYGSFGSGVDQFDFYHAC